MDLLVIPILLMIGGALIYLGVNGMPRLSLTQLSFSPHRQPFSLMDWLKTRPVTRAMPEAPGAEHDAELVELMNEMIAVREELTGLKLAMAGKPGRRRAGRKTSRPQAQTTTRPLMPVRTVERSSEKQAAGRRAAENSQNRRYVRT